MYNLDMFKEANEQMDIDIRRNRQIQDLRSLSQQQAIRYAIAQILAGECLGKGMISLGDESSCIVLWKSVSNG